MNYLLRFVAMILALLLVCLANQFNGWAAVLAVPGGFGIGWMCGPWLRGVS